MKHNSFIVHCFPCQIDFNVIPQKKKDSYDNVDCLDKHYNE